MSAATARQRILSTATDSLSDSLPFFHWWRHCQSGQAERECRNQGMGLNWRRPPYTITMHDVQVKEEKAAITGRTVLRRTYTTPVGSVYCDEIRLPGVGQWHEMRSWIDVAPWQTSRLIKGPEDYPVVQFIVEHTEYEADYLPIEQALDWIGEDGVVVDGMPHSPMQMLMIDWVGSEEGRVFYHLADYPDLVEALYTALCKSRRSLHELVARSPAPVALCGDNVDGFLVSPTLFQKYLMPVYEEQAALLHAHGKLMAVHMDGRLKSLTELIAQTPIDIIEALHAPPMGDLPIADALKAWPDKALWLGFPGAIYVQGPKAAQEYTRQLLARIGTGQRVGIAMSTENLVSNENLIAVTSVLKDARLPLTGDEQS
jgi:hypothetical protein